MCVIMVKPANIAFPEENILKNCWDNNPDMGGFMYALNGHVYIQKGYETWDAFKTALEKSRGKTGDNIPYVCHFRISTQGFDKDCCQPFPLSGSMRNLKRSRSDANIGVAHNGIIELTSDGSKDYSDTMKFITDILVNVIRSYDWAKDKRNIKLIENMIGNSRLSFLDKKGNVELLGKGWIEEKGCYFSNSTYSYKKYYNNCYQNSLFGDYHWDAQSKSWRNIYDDDKDEENRWTDYWDKVKDDTSKSYADRWDRYWDSRRGAYDFSEVYCPCTEEDDDSYCEMCAHCAKCSYVFGCKKAVGETK